MEIWRKFNFTFLWSYFSVLKIVTFFSYYFSQWNRQWFLFIVEWDKIWFVRKWTLLCVFFTFYFIALGLMFKAFLVNSDHFDVFVIVVDDGFSGRCVWLCFDLDCLLDKFDIFFIRFFDRWFSWLFDKMILKKFLPFESSLDVAFEPIRLTDVLSQ